MICNVNEGFALGRCTEELVEVLMMCRVWSSRLVVVFVFIKLLL